MSYAREQLRDVRRRKRLQAEALVAARVALYRARATFEQPETLDYTAVLAEAERILATHRNGEGRA